MEDQVVVSQDERVMAGLAHGSILLGLLTNGIGGIGTALVIWLTQKEKSAYVAAQALQALIYQVTVVVVAMVTWGCWFALWMLLLFPPLMANPEAYNAAPPPGMWVGLTLMACPLGIGALLVLYGLVGAVQALNGRDFKYAIIGDWLGKRA